MHVAFALPAPARTGGGGGADYIDGLAGGLRHIGVTVDVLRGDNLSIPAGAIPIIDGMLLPSLHDPLDPLIDARAVALVHHIAAAATRHDASRHHVLERERAMLPRMSRVIATSVPVAERLRTEMGVSAHVLTPGIRDREPATPDPASPLILSVGVLTRRKGHDRVLRAAARLQDLPWNLVIAGDTQREPAVATELRTLAADLGLADRVSILTDPGGEMLDRLWQRATVFVLATSWEGYPAAVAEAIVRGIPVLVTDAANAAPILPADAGLICPLDDPATFGKCLRRLLFDTPLRADMATAALAAGQALPRWPQRARDFLAILECPA